MTLREAIDETYELNIDLKNIDIEWEALISQQNYNYRKICTSYKIGSLPIKIHLFKAKMLCLHNNIKSNEVNNEEYGWEKLIDMTDFNVIPIDGDHVTMMTDPTNRLQLGQKMSTLLLQKRIKT